MRRSPWWPGIATATVLAVTAATVGTAAASAPPTAGAPPSRAAAKPAAAGQTAAPLTMDQASAQARRTGKAVDADAVETATSTVTADPDGGFTLDTYAQPVRARVSGSWQSFDATLHRDADGTVRPKLTGLGLTLSGGGAGALATLTSGADSLSLTLPTSLPAPVLSGNQATYPNVARGVDLVVTANVQGGFSDVFVVHDAAAAASPALAGLLGASVKTHGVTLTADASGGLRAADARGATVFSAAPAAMWDSATSAASATSDTAHGAASSVAASGTGAHKGRLAATVAGGRLRLAPDQTMLADPQLAYPLFLDPAWSGGKGDWSTPAANFAGSSYWDKSAESAGQMQAGFPVGGGLWADTLINFNLPLNLLGAEGTRSDIVAATFHATVTASSDCTPDTVDVYAPSKTLTGGNATWNDWFTSGDRGGLGGAVGVNNAVPGKWGSNCNGGSTGWNLNTGWITSDVNSGKSLQTLALAGASYGDEQNEAVYDLFDPNSPQLTVKFFHGPAIGSLSTSPNAATIGRGDVVLNAKPSDPDGGTLSVAFTAEVNGNSSEVIKSGTVSTPNNTPAPLLVPQSLLDAADSKYGTAGSVTVTWTESVTVTDTDVSPPASMSASATGKFVYDNAIPGAPDVWSDTGGTAPCEGAAGYTPGVTATFQVGVPSGQTLPTSYSVQINDSAPVTTPAQSGLTPVTVVPTGFADLLTVREINAAGTIGQAATCTFYADHNPPNAAPGDLTGDGVADLLVPGTNTAPLPAGLWLAPGTPAGTPATTVTDIGSDGTGISTAQNPNQWTGVQTTTGMFQGAGYNDVLAYDPGANSTAECVGNVLYPFGQTLPLQPFSGQEGSVAAATFTYYTYDPTGITFTTSCAGSVANGGNLATAESAGTSASVSATPSFPDLLIVAGGALYLAPEQGTVGAWPSLGGNNSNSVASGDYLLSTSSPENGSWTGWTVSTTLVNDLPAMFAISPAGKVYYYSPTDMAELACDSTGPSVGALNSACQSYTVTPSAALATLAPYADVQAVTIGGTVELWAVGADGTVQTWSLDAAGDALTQGSTTPALGTAAHHWPLNDCTTANNAVTAADYGGGTHLALGGIGGAAWTSDDVLGGDAAARACDVLLNGSNAALSTGGGGAALDPTGPFTVSAWADPTAYGGTLISQTGGGYGEFTITEGTGGWSFSLNKGPGTANTFDTVTGGPVTLYSWTQITATYDGGTARLYVNGALVASGGHAPGTKGTNNSLVIGAAQTNGSLAGFFTGQVADVSVLGVAAGPAITPPIQPSGLWALNDGTGTTAADLGTGNHPAAVNSGALWGPGSLTLNGSSPGAATASGVLNTASSYTVSAWVMLQNTTSWHTVLSQDGNVNSAFFLQYDPTDDRWSLSADSADASNPTAVRALSSEPPTIGAWTHLAGVYNASAKTLTLFVNGVQQGTVSYTTAFASNGPLAIGRAKYNGGTTDDFPGSIADVRAYPAALQAGQIAWLDQHAIYTPVTASGAIVNRPLNKCLDDLNRTLAQGAVVDSYDCNGSAAQTWTTNPDHTITTGGWCLDTVGGGTTNTVKVQLSACNGSGTQDWSARTDTNGYVHLVNASGRCLDDPGASLTNGTQMQIYDCLNNYNQTWEPQYRTNLAAGRTATSSTANPSTTTNWSAANLVNGVYRQSPNVPEFSSAGSSTAATEQWAQIDLGSVQPVDEIDLYPRDDSVATIAYGFPTAFTLQTSTDGVTWTTVVSRTNYAKPGDIVQPFPFGVVNARYVRLDATQLTADQYGVYYLQLRQLAVRGR